MKLGELCELTNSLIEVRFNEGEGESFFIIKANASFQKRWIFVKNMLIGMW